MTMQRAQSSRRLFLHSWETHARKRVATDLARASFFAFEIRRLLPAIATGFRKENTRRQTTLLRGIPLRATKHRYAAK